MGIPREPMFYDSILNIQFSELRTHSTYRILEGLGGELPDFGEGFGVAGPSFPFHWHQGDEPFIGQGYLYVRIAEIILPMF